MQAKNVLYAAVGAPVVVARKVSDQVSSLRGKVGENAASYGKAAEKAFDGWAVEGEKVITKINEGKVGEISSKVDLDQAKEQVSKLRDQLEDMLATWRASFRPEKVETVETKESSAPATGAAKKPAAGKPAAKKPAARKPGAKTAGAKTTKAPAKSTTTKATATKDAKAS